MLGAGDTGVSVAAGESGQDGGEFGKYTGTALWVVGCGGVDAKRVGIFTPTPHLKSMVLEEDSA